MAEGQADRQISGMPQEITKGMDLRPEQALLWQPPTDEEVKRISNSVQVTTAGTTIVHPETISRYYDPSQEENTQFKSWKKLVAESGTPVLIDLGSSTRIAGERESTLPKIGITKYIGVDLSDKVQNTEYKKGDLDVQYVHGEALQILHTMPENFGNLWMVGLEQDNVIRGQLGDWTMAILREMKRVVPENGFMVTDGLVVAHALRKLCDTPLLREQPYIDENTANPDDFSQYFVRDGESVRPLIFAFDEPKLGLKIYTDTDFASRLGTIALRTY